MSPKHSKHVKWYKAESIKPKKSYDSKGANWEWHKLYKGDRLGEIGVYMGRVGLGRGIFLDQPKFRLVELVTQPLRNYFTTQPNRVEVYMISWVGMNDGRLEIGLCRMSWTEHMSKPGHILGPFALFVPKICLIQTKVTVK